MTTSTKPVEAVLAKLSISMYDARKLDKKVTARVNSEYAATPDAARVHKSLFGGKVPEMTALNGAYKKLREAHNLHTLPWDDDKVRLLPTANIMEHTKAVREAAGEFQRAAEAIKRAYPRLKKEAKGKLNGMYDERDYPESLDDKYNIDLVYLPLPSGTHFRVGVSKAELEKLAKSTEAHVAETINVSMQDAWDRLGDAVTYLRARLTETDAKNLRQTMVERLAEVAAILGRLNITNDPKLEAVRQRVLKELAPVNVDAVKNDEKALSTVAAQADAILKSMAGLYDAKGGAK
jgi:hypothetical protein